MVKIRIATFNVENLFARYRFRSRRDTTTDGFTINDLAFDVSDRISKVITAELIRHVGADVLALQEVESLSTLERFCGRMLKGMGYCYSMMVEGHDPRFINIALLSRYPIARVHSHKDERVVIDETEWQKYQYSHRNMHINGGDCRYSHDSKNVCTMFDEESESEINGNTTSNTSSVALRGSCLSNHHSKYLFSRDCLEVTVDVDGTPLSLYINHFSAMIHRRANTPAEARSMSAPKRYYQALRVREIVDQTCSRNPHCNVVVMGDLNDKNDNETAIGPLLRWRYLVNVVNRLPLSEQWTHYFSRGNSYQQLDYLLVSRPLAMYKSNAESLPAIYRAGMPLRARRVKCRRLQGVGKNYPKASDHCPVALDVELLPTFFIYTISQKLPAGFEKGNYMKWKDPGDLKSRNNMLDKATYHVELSKGTELKQELNVRDHPRSTTDPWGRRKKKAQRETTTPFAWVTGGSHSEKEHSAAEHNRPHGNARRGRRNSHDNRRKQRSRRNSREDNHSGRRHGNSSDDGHSGRSRQNSHDDSHSASRSAHEGGRKQRPHGRKHAKRHRKGRRKNRRGGHGHGHDDSESERSEGSHQRRRRNERRNRPGRSPPSTSRSVPSHVVHAPPPSPLKHHPTEHATESAPRGHVRAPSHIVNSRVVHTAPPPPPPSASPGLQNMWNRSRTKQLREKLAHK